MTTSSPARVFTQDDFCWLSGAEPFANGDEPVIREIGEHYFVSADKNGVEAQWLDGDGDFTISLAFPTQKAAIAFLNGLPDDFEPEAYGFKPY